MSTLTPRAVVCRECKANIGHPCRDGQGRERFDFHRARHALLGELGHGIEARTAKKARERRLVPWERMLWQAARARAKRKGVPFAVTEADIRAVDSQLCPILGTPMERRSLDRIIPALGYVPGNIAVISHRANSAKGSETDPTVFRRIAEYIQNRRGCR